MVLKLLSENNFFHKSFVISDGWLCPVLWMFISCFCNKCHHHLTLILLIMSSPLMSQICQWISATELFFAIKKSALMLVFTLGRITNHATRYKQMNVYIYKLVVRLHSLVHNTTNVTMGANINCLDI